MSSEWIERWTDIQKLLERPGPFTHVDFEPSSDTLPMIQEKFNILVIGAGGLGCELLKDLGLDGFTRLSVIDMDLIDLSNLNRQFLFRKEDIGRPKAEVAADFINKRIRGCKVTPYYKRIQDFDTDFYRDFHIVVCGLDSIVARRWINWMLLSLLNYEDGMLDQSSIMPMVDGGTEGFKGSVRVILPGITPCIECTLDLFPPQITYPLCTIANTPRIPEHCIEWVKLLLWPKEKPYGDDAIDGDDPLHISWICDRAQKRARDFGIQGVTYRLTQGVVKHIIPAVASTNAVIAAACATETLKLATSICKPMNNYSVFNQASGVYTYTYEQERKEDCLACSQSTKDLSIYPVDTLNDIIGRIKDIYKMEAPSIQTVVDGKPKTLYMHSPASIEKQLRKNLTKSIKELSLVNHSEITVQDVTTPYTSNFRLILRDSQ